MLPSFFDDTVTVLHPERVTDSTGANYGNETLDWDNADEREVVGHLQPVDAPEDVASGRNAIVTRYRLFLPADDPIVGYDRVVVDDVTFEVDGAPGRWRSPTGDLDHVHVLLVQVEG